MPKKIKRKVYLVAFTVLGLVLGVLIEALLELYYTSLLSADFKRFSFGLGWNELFQIRDLFAVLVLLAGGWWGYRAGKHWWHQIYELKKFPNWFIRS